MNWESACAITEQSILTLEAEQAEQDCKHLGPPSSSATTVNTPPPLPAPGGVAEPCFTDQAEVEASSP